MQRRNHHAARLLDAQAEPVIVVAKAVVDNRGRERVVHGRTHVQRVDPRVLVERHAAHGHEEVARGRRTAAASTSIRTCRRAPTENARGNSLAIIPHAQIRHILQPGRLRHHGRLGKHTQKQGVHVVQPDADIGVLGQHVGTHGAQPRVPIRNHDGGDLRHLWQRGNIHRRDGDQQKIARPGGVEAVDGGAVGGDGAGDDGVGLLAAHGHDDVDDAEEEGEEGRWRGPWGAGGGRGVVGFELLGDLLVEGVGEVPGRGDDVCVEGCGAVGEVVEANEALVVACC